MIYSVSHRTDVPAFYWDWFLNRIDAGYVLVRNPNYPEKVSRYDLSPDVVDGFTFTSKNYKPVLDGFPHMMSLSTLINLYPSTWAYTITPYPHDIEPNVPSVAESVETLKRLSDIVSPERLTWLFSPMLIQEGRYNLSYTKEGFLWIAKQVAPYVSRVSVSGLRIHPKVARNAPQIRELFYYEKEDLFNYMLSVGKAYNLKIHTCRAQELTCWAKMGVDMSLCSTLERFGKINDIEMKKLKFSSNGGLFGGCACMDVRDVARYDTCKHGCIYCYGMSNPACLVPTTYDPYSEMLLDELRPQDIVSEAKPRIYRKK